MAGPTPTITRSSGLWSCDRGHLAKCIWGYPWVNQLPSFHPEARELLSMGGNSEVPSDGWVRFTPALQMNSATSQPAWICGGPDSLPGSCWGTGDLNRKQTTSRCANEEQIGPGLKRQAPTAYPLVPLRTPDAAKTCQCSTCARHFEKARQKQVRPRTRGPANSSMRWVVLKTPQGKPLKPASKPTLMFAASFWG